MKSLLNFALPEDLLCVSKEAEAGIPIDAITCAIDRASSVKVTPLASPTTSSRPCFGMFAARLA